MTIYVHGPLIPFKAFVFVMFHREASNIHQFIVIFQGFCIEDVS